MNPKDWWYVPLFLLIQLIECIIGLLTLTYYIPNWTMKYAGWYMSYYFKRLNGGKET